MHPDLRVSKVHVLPNARAAPKRISANSPAFQRFKCDRCKRDLPENQFMPVGASRGRRAFLYLSPVCSLCRKQLRSTHAAHPLTTPKLQRYLGKLAASARAGASRRGIVWALEDDDLLGLFIQQGGRCAATGIAMTFINGRAPMKGIGGDRAWTAASLDRVDSGRNYTLDNVQLVCRAVNLMKNDMSMNELREWCQRVARHSASVERELLAAVEAA